MFKQLINKSLLAAFVLVASPALAVAASHFNAAEVKSLHDGQWLTVQVDGTNAADETNHTLSIAEDGKVTGHSGCNTYTATAIIDGVDLSFKDITVTKIMCDLQAMDAEKEYLAALAKADQFYLNVNVLRIYNSDTKEVLMLRRLGTTF